MIFSFETFPPLIIKSVVSLRVTSIASSSSSSLALIVSNSDSGRDKGGRIR